ncbi:pseudouridine-5'-phosphate glycosidase [Alicyclobacillaceae bacterium I2511]|nr:pseudouridine-5'-phosphate glycosidase [Alicyclobacillaceae bacterium I2511]
MNFNRDYLTYSEEVLQAMSEQAPVVALETTIVTHGMPYPQNVQTALSVEHIIRNHGAVPATICIRNHKIQIGMTEKEIEQLAQTTDVIKASRRDIPIALVSGKTASTTVAATMLAARMANISVFVTGGIGGVHRGAEQTMDISADLQELSKTNVIVVSAGAKAILDIELTLEVLETLGVPVLGYGTERFPAFYIRDSGFDAAFRVDTPEEVARIADTKWSLGLDGGILVANPIPEHASLQPEDIQQSIDAAIAQSKVHGITGKNVTPYLLAAVERLTEGKSLQANIALIEHNANVGAQIAKVYQQYRQG